MNNSTSILYIDASQFEVLIRIEVLNLQSI